MNTHLDDSRAALTTPRAAAVAGILFSLLLMTSLFLIGITARPMPGDEGLWLAKGATRVGVALNLVPFAGVAFLWFIGVLRDRLGAKEDKFFSTVFFGSGLLFLATLFLSTATSGAILQMYATSPQRLLDSGLYTFGRNISREIMTVYTLRMEGVFMISTCTLSLRTAIVPRWMAFVGLALAAFLLLSISKLYWAPLVFPLWVLLISTYILLVNLRARKNGERPPGA